MLLRCLASCAVVFCLSACVTDDGRRAHSPQSATTSSVPDVPSTAMAAGYRVKTPEQCVPYARRLSGIDIFGDAYTWWNKAGTRFARGCVPVPGAVLVLAKSQKMVHGHV